MNWRDVATIIGTITLMSGMMMAIVAWVHAESTIPKILQRTSEQIEKAIERHAKYPHSVSVPRREFDILQSALKEDIGRVEKTIESFKAENKQRLDRIEDKIGSR